MKKILFVIPTMRMGGAEQSLVSLLNQLSSRKYQIDLLLFEKNGELLDRIPKYVRVMESDTVTRAMLLEFRYFFSDLLHGHHYYAAAIRILMLLNSKLEKVFKRPLAFNWNLAKHTVPRRMEEYDIAVGYLEGATDAYVIDKISAKRKIAWIHTDFSLPGRHLNAEKKYYSAYDALITISELCLSHFIDIYPNFARKISVIENITNRDMILRKAEEPIEKSYQIGPHTLVTVGRLEKVKGIDLALEAAKILHDRGIEFSWHVFGDGAMHETLQKRICELKMENYFFLEGTTSNPYKYMKCAEVVVQPSRNEGKSIVLDEAKILNKPIVVTNYPSAKDQITDGITGLIVEITPNSIADGINRILSDMSLGKELSENCRTEEDQTEVILNKISKILEGE